MSVITISRGSYSMGKKIAEMVADRLGYECIAREALLEASKEYNIAEAKLIRAIHDAPTILDRFAGGKERYIAYIQAALTNHVKHDNVVYHGLAGHFLLEGISHVLKVRIITPLDHRVHDVVERDGVTPEEAISILRKDDEERHKWSRKLYGIDQTDSSLYDLVLNIDNISVEDAVDIICRTAELECFRTTPQSRKAMEDLALASEVRSYVMGLKPDVEVHADDGIVFIKTEAYAIHKDTFSREIRKLAMEVPGVKEVRVQIESTPRFYS